MLCTQNETAVVDATSPLKTRMRASLRLRFACDDVAGDTKLTFSHQDPPLRVVRAFQTGKRGAMAHLHNVSGGVFGGDELSLQVEVGKGAEAQLTTTGATRVYRRGLGNAIARQHCQLDVSENALLEYVPDTIIPFAAANFYQQTVIRLGPNAGLFWWEILAPGREASNEVFAYECVEMRTEITSVDKLISVDRMRLEPGKTEIGSPGRMGSYRHCATSYVCKVGVNPEIWLDLERHLRQTAQDLPRIDETLWGISTLKAHGLMIRCLARQGPDVTSGLVHLWDAAKLALYHRHAVRPRKTH